jgi:hypothetical protein
MNINDNFTKNPYIFGKPIYNIKNLYGRQDIFNRIKYNFNNEIKITLLHVQRRIGKTSLITCLPQFFTEDQNDFEFVTFSFQGYKREKIPQILNYLADDIASTIGELPKQVRETADSAYNFFNIFLPKIIDEYLLGKKLVLLLDEFDVLQEDERTDNANGGTLFKDLEKAVKEQEKLFAILVFGRPLTDMKYLATFLQKEGQKAIEVGLLNQEGTKNLIVKPAEETLKYEDGAIDAIWKLSAGHPSLTQLLCFSIFDYCREGEIKNVTDNHVKSILEQAMIRGEAVLSGFLNVLNENEQLFFREVAEAQKSAGEDQTQITIRSWPSVGQRLVEYGFLQKTEDPIGYKIKVELVQRWLVKEYPLSNEMPQQKGNKNFQEPNPIAKAISLGVLLLILSSLLGYSFFRIFNSLETKRSRLECSRLLEDINVALRKPKERLRVIEETRKRWSRKEESLDAQCSYPETNKLDAKYNELLHLYGFNIIDRREYEEAIILLCEITEEYEGSSKIKKDIFVKWISTDGPWDRKKIIEKLIEQNESENDCLIYSFKNPRNKDQLYEQRKKLYEQRNKQRNKQYYQEAENYRKDFKFEKAVESYCKISREYDGFDDIVEQLKGWLSNDSDLYPNERQKVEEKLQELNNQCPVSPLNDITN